MTTSPIDGTTHLNRLALLKEPAVTTADAANAAGATPTQAEFDAVVTLVNALKAKLNVICKG